MLQHVKNYSIFDQEVVMKDRYEFCYQFSEKWQKSGLSALVLPTFPHCAFRHSENLDMGLMLDYLWLWNVLEYPSGTVTVTQVQEDE